MTPVPPLLAIRPRQAFWIEESFQSESACTLQAFRDGCFDGVVYLDSVGQLWPLESVALVATPSWLDRVLPWRLVRVRVILGNGSKADLEDVRERLLSVIPVAGPETGFDWLSGPTPDELREMIRAAQTPAAFIQAVSQLG